MRCEVILEMNTKIIISLAYLRINENPLQVFCNMIERSLCITNEKTLSHAMLYKSIKDDFGLILPQNIVKVCIKSMEKKGIIESLGFEAGYRIKKSSFNISMFDEDLKKLKQKETKLLNDLIQFVGYLNKDMVWSEEVARNNLTEYLMQNGTAYNLFVRQYSLEMNEDESEVIPSMFYVQKYIVSLLAKERDYVLLNYLMSIVEGLMVYVGAYYTEENIDAQDEMYKGTRFFLDTKLLLRFLGYSFTANVKAAIELVNEIKEKGGKIYVFEHNVEEAEYALRTVANKLKQNPHELDIDREIRLYARTKNRTALDFESFANGIRRTIEEKHGLNIVSTIGMENNERNRKYIREWEAIRVHIEKLHASRNKDSKAVSNDVDSIKYINMMRRGNYNIRFGGKDKLPVLVTTNYGLVRAVKEFVTKDDDDKADWFVECAKRLPVIADTLLMCLLWIPNKSRNNIPLLTFSGYVATIQQGDINFYQSFRAEAEKAKETFQGVSVDLKEDQVQRMENILSDTILYEQDTSVTTATIEEMIELEKEAARIKNKELNSKINEQDIKIKNMQKKVIDIYVNQVVMNLYNRVHAKFFRLIAKWWWVISIIFVSSFSIGLNYSIENYLIKSRIQSILIPIVILCSLKVVDLLLFKNNVSLLINKKCCEAIKKNIQKYIIKKNIKEHTEEIIARCEVILLAVNV